MLKAFSLHAPELQDSEPPPPAQIRLQLCNTACCSLLLVCVCLDNAVVYGNGIDVFIAVKTLQELGVQGHRIHVALTAPEPGVLCFSEPEVEKAVMAALEKAEVQVHHHCLLAHMNQGDPGPDWLTSVSFTTNGGPLHLPCGVGRSFRDSCARI